jgi:signal transduction histidine kinase
MKVFLFIPLLFLVTCSQKETEEEDLLKKYFEAVQNNNTSYLEKIDNNRKAILLLNKKQNDSSVRKSISKIGWNFYILNDWENLKMTSEILHVKGNDANDSISIADSFELKGLYFENISSNDSALAYYLKAKNFFLKKSQFKRLCNIYIDIANLQYYSNDYLGSESSLTKGLKITKSNNLPNAEFEIYSMLGINSNELREYDQALHYHLKALKIIQYSNLTYNNKSKNKYLIDCLNNIGYNFFTSNKNNEAIKFFKLALIKCNINEYPFMSAKVRDNLAKAKLNRGEIIGVENLLFHAAKIRDSLNINQGQNFNRLYLSEYYTAIKDTTKAKQYANEAYSLSKSFKAPNDMMLCLKELSKIDPKNALQYSAQYIKISDSMHQLERENRNKFAKIAYETEEITQEKELAEKQKSIFLGTTIIVTTFGILLLIIAGQRIRQKELIFSQSQQKAKEEIYQLIHTQQSKIDEGRQIEKKRIARDLHDGIMNRLASTRFNLYVLNNKPDEKTVKSCIPYIDGIHDIEKEIRSIAHDLNKEVFSENDSFKRILLTFFEEQKNILDAKLHVDIDKSINWQLMESNQKINLYRILQEVFQNAGKHSHAEHIFVGLTNQSEYILLEIHDDGVGFSVDDKKKGIGLQNLRARAKDCKGIFHVNSSNGNGTTIIVSIPVTKKNIT